MRAGGRRDEITKFTIKQIKIEKINVIIGGGGGYMRWNRGFYNKINLIWKN